ncbi:MAG: hypothetical protein ACK4PR_07655 [Gammaproteobacteria bacterium]
MSWLSRLFEKHPTLKITSHTIKMFSQSSKTSLPSKKPLMTSLPSFFRAVPKTNTEEEVMTINTQYWLQAISSPQAK